jgi:L-amino acid N-acyltransferase YncA
VERNTVPTLRAATPDDFAAITTIYGDHVRDGTATFEIEPPDLPQMLRRWREVTESGLPYLVAVLGDEVAGYAYAGAYRPRPAYRFTVEDSIYLRRDRVGQGIGRALLAALVADCERAGARQMIAVIGDSGNAASIRLHAGAGFAPIGVLIDVGWKFDRWLDVVLMQRPLGPGARVPAT